MTTNQVTANTTPQVLLPQHFQRQPSPYVAATDCYVGGPSVSGTTGLLCKAGIPYYHFDSDALYVVTASGTALVTCMDSNSFV
jgi:hypothetical protein